MKEKLFYARVSNLWWRSAKIRGRICVFGFWMTSSYGIGVLKLLCKKKLLISNKNTS